MSQEVWLPVVGYEGFYEVSDLGRVKSLNYNHTGKGKIMKPTLGTKGYYYVGLSYKIKKTIKVHRLVITAFIENKENGIHINHINGIKTDNSLENLEWCTASENMIHARNTGLLVSKFGGENKLSRAIVQYSKDMVKIREWGSTMDIERLLGIHHGNISYCCKLRVKSAGGYIWRYK